MTARTSRYGIQTTPLRAPACDTVAPRRVASRYSTNGSLDARLASRAGTLPAANLAGSCTEPSRTRVARTRVVA
jgi:hypothetical protein